MRISCHLECTLRDVPLPYFPSCMTNNNNKEVVAHLYVSKGLGKEDIDRGGTFICDRVFEYRAVPYWYFIGGDV